MGLGWKWDRMYEVDYQEFLVREKVWEEGERIITH